MRGRTPGFHKNITISSVSPLVGGLLKGIFVFLLVKRTISFTSGNYMDIEERPCRSVGFLDTDVSHS